MSNDKTASRNGWLITTYIPVFKDKLARLERCGRGRSEEAQRLRAAVSFVETHSRPLQDKEAETSTL